jgi:hypothetical protein
MPENSSKKINREVQHSRKSQQQTRKIMDMANLAEGGNA